MLAFEVYIGMDLWFGHKFDPTPGLCVTNFLPSVLMSVP